MTPTGAADDPAAGRPMDPAAGRPMDPAAGRPMDPAAERPMILPLRPNVGVVLFNRRGLVLVARRADFPNAEGAAGGWQLPQGGMDAGEDPLPAALRELKEEVGTDRATLLAEYPGWLDYDLPAELIGRALGGKWRGQTQKWFALRFVGEDADIRLDLDLHPEFDAWRWARLEELPPLAVSFKRPIYAALAREFAPYSAPL